MNHHDRIIASLSDGWVMWRAPDGRIILQLHNGKLSECLEGATLSEVLRKADGYKPLPRLKRRPKRFVAADWEPAKVGKRWQPRFIKYGIDCPLMECYLKTRKECQETIDRFDRLSRERQEQWDAEFSKMFPDGATEGVDYRWEGE